MNYDHEAQKTIDKLHDGEYPCGHCTKRNARYTNCEYDCNILRAYNELNQDVEERLKIGL